MTSGLRIRDASEREAEVCAAIYAPYVVPLWQQSRAGARTLRATRFLPSWPSRSVPMRALRGMRVCWVRLLFEGFYNIPAARKSRS